MAVCRQDMLYNDCTSNPIPTSFFISFCELCYEITGKSNLCSKTLSNAFFRSKNTVHTSLPSCSELVQPCTVDARAVAVDLCGQTPTDFVRYYTSKKLHLLRLAMCFSITLLIMGRRYIYMAIVVQ